MANVQKISFSGKLRYIIVEKFPPEGGMSVSKVVHSNAPDFASMFLEAWSAAEQACREVGRPMTVYVPLCEVEPTAKEPSNN